jgi:hypothetical protein
MNFEPLTKDHIKTDFDQKLLREFMGEVKKEIHEAIGFDCMSIGRRIINKNRFPVLVNHMKDDIDTMEHMRIRFICNQLGYRYVTNPNITDDWILMLPKPMFIAYKRKYLIDFWVND